MKRMILITGVIFMLLLSAFGLEKENKSVSWSISYGTYEGVERFAIQELHKIVSDYYPDCLQVEEAPKKIDSLKGNVILLGTAENNPIIAKLIKEKVLTLPKQAEGYTIYANKLRKKSKEKLIVIAGTDANGVLYGVEDFGAQIIAPHIPDFATKENKLELLDSLSEFKVTDYPKIKDRGIWTWGYKIYDYRKFLDNMARLKLNMITIWNTEVPVNINEFIDYAHSRGIQVVMGFHWGWGYEKASITTKEGKEKLQQIIVDNFKQNYASLDLDAIYFQTQTEHFETKQKGRSVASHACEFVNNVSAELLEIKPGLAIHFGLHATSIQGDYTKLNELRKEITIIWEDAGVIPYFYAPTPYFTSEKWKQSKAALETPKGTLHYSQKLAELRKETPFGMVAKGWTNLNWNAFKNHQSFLIGEYSEAYVKEKRAARESRWNDMNAKWIKNYPFAHSFYKEMLPLCQKGMIVQALIEDGGFEESIEISAALFGVMVWDPTVDSDELFIRANSMYYH